MENNPSRGTKKDTRFYVSLFISLLRLFVKSKPKK